MPASARGAMPRSPYPGLRPLAQSGETLVPAGLTPAVQAAAPWRLAHVEVLPGFRLHLRFNDGTEGNVELSAFLHSGSAGVFAALRDATLFAQARIECGAITWPGDLDLAPDAMHRTIKAHETWIVE
jgi:hypothetical protein